MKTLKRRRKEHKTDYGKRIKLLKSKSPRVIFRKTNKYILSQYISSREAQDKIILSINSKKLIKYGWPENAKNSLKSLPASYFTGLLIGKGIIKGKLDTPIVDLGMIRVLHKTKIYAFIKGLIDAGIKIKCKEDAFPSEGRIKGEHMKNKIQFDEIKSKIEKI
ncbi:MAG TPA: 50S ribosomal protein L18 [Candidatus Pacearchaeota archaeon]|nr:50S ribosomal protein L18P [archaeon BMS3Abin17]HDK42260.1 50S ribosomal protein L18 [Candidatus Pacearchaeota archaeon]HDZ60404.1 50S ribosomal protein L18 [Candidatus Pacearchaeota archaeon]